MNTNDLYVEYARVIEMCKGTALENEPWRCLKIKGSDTSYIWCVVTNHPLFNHYNEDVEIKFAVEVLEDKPVWIGSVLYDNFSSEPRRCVVTGRCETGLIINNDVATDITWLTWKTDASWTPPAPKRTFTLNGLDLPCPEKRTKSENILFFSFDVGLETFYFHLIEDRDKTCKALINLLTEARDK